MKNKINQTEDILKVDKYKKDFSIEKLWKEFFRNEYKANSIDFLKIKNYLIEKRKEYGNREIEDYNYKIMHPENLCDYFIENNIDHLNISSLELLPENIKGLLADLFLEFESLDSIKINYGEAMLFWIRHNCYYYGNKRNKDLKTFLIRDTVFVGSQENYNLLEKSRMYQRQLHRLNFDIKTTLLQYQIFINLSKDIINKEIKEYIQRFLGSDFSLGVFNSRGDNTKGKEKEWYRRDVDNKGKPIESDKLDDFYTYIKDEKTGNSLSVVNRNNLDIYKDMSGRLYKIYLDGPIAIGLFHKNNPVALISFSLKNLDTMFIHQMQTIIAEYFDKYGRTIEQKTDPIVQVVSWQKILYDVLIIISKKYGCKNIIIQSGENNEWINILRTELSYDEEKNRLVEIKTKQSHLSLDISQKIYDTFAQKEGYKIDKNTKNWNKKITT